MWLRSTINFFSPHTVLKAVYVIWFTSGRINKDFLKAEYFFKLLLWKNFKYIQK